MSRLPDPAHVHPGGDDAAPGRHRLLSWLGMGTAIVGLGFLVIRLALDRDAVGQVMSDASPWLLAASLVPVLAGQWATTVAARLLLSAHGGRSLGLLGLYRILFASNVAKYVPGGVWQVGAHYQLATAAGMGSRHALALWLEIARVTVSGSLLVAGAGALLIAERLPVPGWVGLVAMAGGVVLALPIGGRLVMRVLRVSGVQPTGDWHPWLLAVAVTMAGAIVTGVHGMLLAAALGSDIGLTVAVVAFVGAWVIGFLVFFVPAGLGVREAVLVFLLSPWADPPLALAIAVASRLVFMVADAIGAAAAFALGAVTRRQ